MHPGSPSAARSKCLGMSSRRGVWEEDVGGLADLGHEDVVLGVDGFVGERVGEGVEVGDRVDGVTGRGPAPLGSRPRAARADRGVLGLPRVGVRQRQAPERRPQRPVGLRHTVVRVVAVRLANGRAHPLHERGRGRREPLLDGELVVWSDGQLAFDALQLRMNRARAAAQRRVGGRAFETTELPNDTTLPGTRPAA